MRPRAARETRAPKFSEVMRPPKIFKRLTPLVIAAILLSFAAPVSDAQRRRTRSRTRTTQSARRSTPRATPAQTQIPPRPAAVSTQTPATGAQPSNSDAAANATNATGATGADEQRGPQDERTFEEMVGADTYGAYVELRRVGTLAQANELKTALAGLKLFGDADTKPVSDLIEFVTANYEPLAEARFVLLFMAARPRVPVVVTAVEFPSAQDAAAFEPKYRQFADEQLKVYRTKYDPPKPSAERRTTRRGGRALPKPEAKQTQFDYTLKRVGRVLISAEKGLSLKRLRGEEFAPALADSARFQNARTRFSSDSLFVYVDTGVTMHGFSRMGQEAEAGGVDDGSPGRAVVVTRDMSEQEIAVIAPTSTATLEAAAVPVEAATPESVEGEEGDEEELTEEQRKLLAAAEAEAEAANKPSEEQVAVNGMGGLMRSLWGGMPRIPGAFALGARLDNGAVVLRLAVENTSDGKVSIIPFLPNFVAGPPVTAAAAEVAPADADIFFTTSLDWEQIYISTIGSASLSPTLMMTGSRIDDDGGRLAEGESKPLKPEETIAVVEKLFGFKFKEDLIPALGNEIGFSMPFNSNDLGLGPSRRRMPKMEEKEKESEAGVVVIISLNDPEKIRKILPRVLTALGFVPLGGQPSQSEWREGFEINSAGGFVYSIIDRFLVVGENAAAVRHVADSYAARRTLASTDSYRDATAWQAPQKIVQAFVSETLMRATVEETKRRSGESTDPLVRTLLDQLQAPPESASFETTNEGDAVVHELRVPVSMIQTYALALAVGARDAPVLYAESSAMSVLYELSMAESRYKEEKKGRYGTLEELVAEKILDKSFAENSSYQIEVNASGEKFDATATPREYGKHGRLSFFIDESGTLRAADHKGKPADASDPPVD